MKYMQNKINELKIAYIGGGSRGWAWTFMTDLAMEEQLSGTIALYDIDKEAAKANEIIGNGISAREDVVGKWNYQTMDTMKDALTGADFVVISILPKSFDEMEVDVHMPEHLGIYQSVGDTAGPGGIMRALRTIPMFQEIASAIRDYCPNAWVINYTNPMSLCVKTLYEVFPEIKAFGCCHEVFGTQKVLAGIASRELGIESIGRKDVHVNVLGINHFTWFDSASYKGIDLFPVYKKFIEENFKEGYQEENSHWEDSYFNCAHRVKMDLFNRFGLIAAAGDRHLAEFMPGNEYLADPETVHSWNFSLTPVSWRKEDLQERRKRSEHLLSGTETIKLNPTGEEGILLIKALCGLDRVISNVNIPNTNGQIPNLPKTAVVETNAVFERDSVRPVLAGELPEQIYDLVIPHVENHERVYKAVINNMDRALIEEAFSNDPLVKGRATKDEIHQLVKDMISATL